MLRYTYVIGIARWVNLRLGAEHATSFLDPCMGKLWVVPERTSYEEIVEHVVAGGVRVC